jgi:ankyrin repeat protein
MKATLVSALLLIPCIASSDPWADATPCQQELLNTYFNLINAPDRGLKGDELDRARYHLGSLASQCPWPGSGINLSWWRNVSALEIAIVAHDPNQVRSALSELTGVEISEWQKPGRVDSAHPALIAAIFGNREIIELLMSSGITIDVKDEYGISPLTLAVLRKDHELELVDFIIQSGVDVDEVDDHGSTALGLAVHLDNLIVVRYLLEKGARICPGGPDDISILDRIDQTDPTDLQPLLRKHALSPDLGCIANSGLRERPAADSRNRNPCGSG